MKSPDRPYEGHLTLREFSVPAGGVWSPPWAGWLVIKVGRGAGYYLGQQAKQELDPGSLLLLPPLAKGSIRASQLGELSSAAFNVLPARLTGLISLVEQRQLELAVARQADAVRIFSPASPEAASMEALQAGNGPGGLRFRLDLLQFFVELVGSELAQTMPKTDTSDARQRLQSLLQETPSSEFLDMNFNELAQQARCTSRHLGRIFQELVGMSFRDKRAEIRLEKALELLATTDSKVVDVALESGFKSLSLFNLMFARRFGISPGRWRQKRGTPGDAPTLIKTRRLSRTNGLLISARVNSFAHSK